MKAKLRALLLSMTLLVGLFGGVPMRPEEVEELMRSMSRPKVACTISDASDQGDPKTPG